MPSNEKILVELAKLNAHLHNMKDMQGQLLLHRAIREMVKYWSADLNDRKGLAQAHLKSVTEIVDSVLDKHSAKR